MPKLKAFNKSEKEKIKKVILGIPILLTVIAIVIVASSYAIFQRQDEAQLIRATVGNFNNKGDILLAITVNGKEVDVPPSKNKYTVTVDCDNATGTWDSDRWGANIDNITAANVKCNINFETPKPTLTEVKATSGITVINLSYTAEGIGTTTTCKYGIESGNYTNTATDATNTACSITGLSEGTTYYYQVCATNAGGETCKEGNSKTGQFVVGDYIKMTPTATSYTISKSITGYTNSQVIRPSELNLWRVIKKNDDGTVDVVSEYVSSAYVYLYGQSVYRNIAYYLNEIADGYTNEKYVENARHMKEIDTSLVKEATGTLAARTPSGTAKDYWLATSYNGYLCPNSGPYYLVGQISYQGATPSFELGSPPCYSGPVVKMADPADASQYTEYAAIRPILTLKSSVLLAGGDGKSAATAYTFK